MYRAETRESSAVKQFIVHSPQGDQEQKCNATAKGDKNIFRFNTHFCAV